MTNGSVAPLFSILMSLLLPSAVAGVVFGSALVVVGWQRKQRDAPRLSGELVSPGTVEIGLVSRLERIPVFICGVVAFVLTIAQIAVAAGRKDFHPLVLLMLMLMLLLGSPTLLWRSSWREPAVGAATVAVSVLAFMTGFSIGVVFVPLVIAMALVCFSYLRRAPLVDSVV